MLVSLMPDVKRADAWREARGDRLTSPDYEKDREEVWREQLGPW